MTAAQWKTFCRALRRAGDYIVEWRTKKGFVTTWDNVMEKLMLVVTEVSEAAEAFRYRVVEKERWRDGRRGRSSRYTKQFAEELADAAIRIIDLAYSLGIDLGAEIQKKMAANEKRPLRHRKGL